MSFVVKYIYINRRLNYKINNGIQQEYYLDKDKVIYEKTGSNTIYYTYDATGEILGLKYNNDQYYYIKNAQNDVIGILNSNLEQVVSYTYDSWGNIISAKDKNGSVITDTNNIGLINPYRYRGYRYDKETGLYYLQSRYYNPEMGRFINADGLFESGSELLGNNLYSYCANNPIMNVDKTGKSLTLISGILLTFVVIGIVYSLASIPQETWNSVGNSLSNAVSSIKITSTATQSAANKNKKITTTATQSKVTTKTTTAKTTSTIANTLMSKKGPSINLPKIGKPNSIGEILNPDGTVKQKRIYGPDGKALKDIDYNHQGKFEFPHEHKWDWDGDSSNREKH